MSASLFGLPPPGYVHAASMTVEQRCCEHRRHMLLHTTTYAVALDHLQPASPQAQHPRTSLTALAHRKLPDVYDVRSDPSDGAGAGVNVSTREVRGTGLAAVGEMGSPCGEVGLRVVCARRWCRG